MEVKDLQREIISAERIAELGRNVLGLDQKYKTLQAELGACQAELAALKSLKQGAENDD